MHGGVAQLARACGSYPQCHWFESSRRYHRLVRRRQRLTSHPPQQKDGPLVKWLRHGPFTAVTWVRVPYGSPLRQSVRGCRINGGLAQLVRAPASHAGGRWFESISLHHLVEPKKISTRKTQKFQLFHPIGTQCVMGVQSVRAKARRKLMHLSLRLAFLPTDRA